MGSIVKTIGKVIKKVGKVLKKIAPVLLVAAAAYIGYGYMTGFQQGGWPQITEWGKSLMGGVSQGQTLSQAANAAGGMTDGGITTALPDTTPIAEPIDGMGFPSAGVEEAAISSDPSLMTDAGLIGSGDGMGLPSEGGGLLTEIQDATNTRFTALMDQSLYPPLSNQVSGYLEAPAKQGGIGDFFLGTAQANPMQTGTPWAGMGDSPNLFNTGHPGMMISESPAAPFSVGGDTNVTPTANVAQTQANYSPNYTQGMGFGLGPDKPQGIPHPQDPSFLGMMAGMGKKAWGVYKGMWKDNPWMAAWTTQKVIQTIAALLDDTAEKESYRSRHVAGFEPGNWGDLRKKYGGNLPGGPATGVWAGDSHRQPSLRAGPQIASRIPTSTLDRKPQGLVGKQVERVVG